MTKKEILKVYVPDLGPSYRKLFNGFGIILTEATKPKTFVEKIELNCTAKVVILDDDKSIHELWKVRFQSLVSSLCSVELIHFFCLDDCKIWMAKNYGDVFLIDYEFVGQKETGLDFILSNHLRQKAILVTSRYEEPDVQKRCEIYRVGLIPKSLAPFVPIKIIPK